MHEIYKQNDLPYIDVKVCPNCQNLVPSTNICCSRCGYEVNKPNIDVEAENVDAFETTQLNKEEIDNEVFDEIQETETTDEELKEEAPKDEKEEKKYKPSLFLRRLFNGIAIAILVFAGLFLIFNSYFTLNELTKDGTSVYSINMPGYAILTLDSSKFIISNGIKTLNIFSNGDSFQKIGSIALCTIYIINLLAIVIGIIVSIIKINKRQKPSSTLFGILLIPSVVLWVFSFIHSKILGNTGFMKSNDFKVGITSIYVFLLMFVLFILVTLVFIKDKGEEIPAPEKKNKKNKNKQKSEEFSDLFAD